MSTSVGSNTSSMPVIELTVVPPSLIESAAMCEWQSMIPGETNLPAAVDDLGAGRHRHVRADRGDLAAAQDDRAVLDRASRCRQDRRAADRDDRIGGARLRLRPGRERRPGEAHEENDSRRKRRADTTVPPYGGLKAACDHDSRSPVSRRSGRNTDRTTRGCAPSSRDGSSVLDGPWPMPPKPW